MRATLSPEGERVPWVRLEPFGPEANVAGGYGMTDAKAHTSEDAAGAAPTRALAAWIAEFDGARIGENPMRWARHAILDWLGVTTAGSNEALVDILVEDALAEGEAGSARLVGRAERVTPASAALINGAASHALDFDDVNMRMHGHPTVPVVPAILALAERRGATGRAFLEAFVVGYEVECLIGEMVGTEHYDRGFHATATIGTFGAAAGAARLMGLDAGRTAMALGLAATQAAGLKSMFGTMCKPLHAGRAAMGGLMAARLAARGFTSNPDALECPQGFGATQSTEFRPLPVRPDPGAPFAVEANLFKYHAACYLTHSSIEAARALRAEHGFAPADVTGVRARVRPTHLTVCDIAAPRTGLEVKFSLRHAIAMALAGVETGDRAVYTAETATRPDLVALREKVRIEPKAFERRTGAELVVDLADGRSLVKLTDVGIPAEDIEAQEQKLEAKFLGLAGPVIGRERAEKAAALVAALDGAESVGELLGAVS